MSIENVLIAVAMAWFFWLSPRFSCALATATCLYLWMGTGEMNYGFIAGIFAIGSAIAGLKDLELKIEEKDE